MVQGDWVPLSSVRREIHKDVYAVLEPLEASGWTVRRQGHKIRIYCPCEGDDAISIRVDGTPKNPTGQARRIAREAGHCPDRHDLNPRGVSH